jgi:nucleotide-binding universal stress UspA family protein
MATRLLLPFTHGVDIIAIEQAILLAKSLEATLIPLSVIHVPQEGRSSGARLEHIQQSKDFLEAVKYKAARYDVPVERFEVFTADIVQCINIVAKEQRCEGILLFVGGKKGVLLQADEIKCLMETMVCKLYIMRMQSNGNKGSVQTFRERLSNWLSRGRQGQQQELRELQSYTEEKVMSPIEIGRLN